MRLSNYLCGLVGVCLAVSAAPAVAAPKYILAEAARPAADGRTVQVMVAQSEIKTNINKSNLVVATGGGLLGALIDAGIEAQRTKKAEEAIQPLRAALTGYDVDALALATTKDALAKVAWFQAAPEQTFVRDTSPLAKSAVLDASKTNQVAFIEYVYDTSPDFSAIRVSVTVQLANKAVPEGKKPESRLQPKQLAYAQTITSVVLLPMPTKELLDNGPRWSADNARLARKALEIAFADLGARLPTVLEWQEADVKAMGDRTKKVATLGGYMGRIQEQSPAGTLLFNGGQVYVQTSTE